MSYIERSEIKRPKTTIGRDTKGNNLFKLRYNEKIPQVGISIVKKPQIITEEILN
jgi:hypothetical protein